MPVLDLSDPVAVDRYAAFVRAHPLRALSQDPRWGIVKDDWGQEAVYVERDGQIVAAMSLLVRRLPGGFSVLYAPRGPLVDWDDHDLVLEILEQAAPLVRKHRAVMTKFDPEVTWSTELDAWLRAQPGWVVKNVGADKDDLVQPRYCMIVSLRDEEGRPLDEETLLAKYDGKARNRVRAGRRRGVRTVVADTEEGLSTFHDIYTFMARRNEITARGLPYFHRMREAFGERMRVVHAVHEDDVLAASVTIDYHGKLYYLYAGSNDTKRNLSPNQVMNHDLMVWGLSTGAESYDMGGVFALDESDGLYLFKRAFCKADGGATEFIGEVDVVHRRAVYAVLQRLVPRVQRARRAAAATVSQARKTIAARRAS
ncbi:lipid II:glycine glycyltransferase FemX [Ornithinimicrobium flavum]|uniref:lipid II:glycine glycyltransferase FemX n=1 Tax=Ornithinimicrobium flavum TaxID=1288636 RepID=UPI00106FEFB0|nr:peptidoglycan bridge formation glycyltransferase FemA/FemB family protein [Ornithinimicrobium flavum]